MLFADREESDGYTRREVDKIYQITMRSGQFFIAGAGTSDMVTKANAEISEVLFKAQNAGKDLAKDHKDLIETALQRIHKQYAANLKGSYLDLLIIFAPFDQRYVPILYKTALAALIPESVYAAYGSGKVLCDYFAGRLYEYGRQEKDAMKVLAAFILREAERAASGVGLGADMWFIHEGDKSAHCIPTGAIRELQALIPEIQESIGSDWKDKVKIPQYLSG